MTLSARMTPRMAMEGGAPVPDIRRRLSVRTLILLISASIALASCAGVAGVLVMNARHAVEREIASAFDLARMAATLLLAEEASGFLAVERVDEIVLELDGRRHVAATLVGTPVSDAPASAEDANHEAGDVGIPAWFAALIRPPLQSEVFSAPLPGNATARIRLTSDPADETAEVWEDFRIILPALLAVALACTLSALAFGRIISQRLARLSHVVREIRAGETRARAPGERLQELSALADGINALAAQLRGETAENAKLRTRMLTLCESERARIGSDLHDEMGPELFALNAAAGQARAALARLPDHVRAGEAAGFAEAVDAILRHTAAIQKCARDAINDLRPNVPGAATLGEMLEEIVAGFADAAENTRFIVRADAVRRPGRADEITEVTIYRFVRESVLNALRHGEPDLVEVSLRSEGDGLLGRVADTGAGFPFSHTVPGCGQTGMRERARALGALYCPPWREAGRTITELRVPLR